MSFVKKIYFVGNYCTAAVPGLICCIGSKYMTNKLAGSSFGYCSTACSTIVEIVDDVCALIAHFLFIFNSNCASVYH